LWSFRCQKDGRENNSGRNESGSNDSTTGSFEQSEDIAEKAKGGPKKRLKPGPVPKLEHMSLQSFQEGGYFDMQIQVSDTQQKELFQKVNHFSMLSIPHCFMKPCSTCECFRNTPGTI
jgi:hypothetical protein